MKPFLQQVKSNFFAGLAVVLPIFFSVAVILWIASKLLSITNLLFIFFPRSWFYDGPDLGHLRWHWSGLGLVLCIAFVVLVGAFTRLYFGRAFVKGVEGLLLRVPLLNKIYSTLKQVNEAFSPQGRSSFQRVVLVKFPHPESYSVGFVTAEAPKEMQTKEGQALVSVFVPTTPNPTGGFLLMVPEDTLIPLSLSVADGIKYIVSLGSIGPQKS